MPLLTQLEHEVFLGRECVAGDDGLKTRTETIISILTLSDRFGPKRDPPFVDRPQQTSHWLSEPATS